jgi:hypothetical protein
MAEGGVDTAIRNEIQEIESANKTPATKNKEKINLKNVPSIKEEVKNLDNDPDVVEHVDKAEIEAKIRKIGEFYSVPQLAIEQGLKSEIYIVKSESFNKALMENEMSDLSDKEKTDEVIKNARMHAETTGGVSIIQEDGGSLILVKEESSFGKEHSKLHELLHAMSVGKNGEHTGFKKRTTEKEFDKSRNDINEAVTEILTLSLEYPDLRNEEIYDGIISGKIDANYKYNVLRVLNVLSFTDHCRKPFTIKDLAKFYFHGYEGEGDAADLLKTALKERISEGLFKSVEPVFQGDLENK